MTPAFLTGSQRYGTPKRKSDIDLVVLMTPEELNELADIAGYDHETRYDSNSMTFALRFGKLNLICCTTQTQYEVWKDGTDTLVEQSPVTRDTAVELFKKLRRAAGLSGRRSLADLGAELAGAT